MNLLTTFISPPQNIEYYSLGFNEVLADLLWVRWIQNIDECGKKMQARSSVMGSTETVDEKYTSAQKTEVCNQGWAFQMLDAVTDLSPRFRIAYAVGGTSLSVITEDHIGAKKIYEKAVIYFPKDWPILYRAAYHYLFELNDFANASKLLKQAADNGAPDWVYSLSARLASKAGQIEFGVKVLQDYLGTITKPFYRREIEERIEKLKLRLPR